MSYTNKKDLYKNQIFRWRRIKEKAISFLGGSCIKCGFNSHPAAMQFHHDRPSEKEFTWTKLRLKSWDKIEQELIKCTLLCANCHAIHHSTSKYD